jgi:hypothetical protein
VASVLQRPWPKQDLAAKAKIDLRGQEEPQNALYLVQNASRRHKKSYPKKLQKWVSFQEEILISL